MSKDYRFEAARKVISIALDEATDAIEERGGPGQRVGVGVVAKLRAHEDALAEAGVRGAARILLHASAGDASEARLAVLHAKGHLKRRAARRAARLAAHAERKDHDDALDALYATLIDVGEVALREALPFLLRGLLAQELSL